MFAFEEAIALDTVRPEKPRTSGLNWAIDWGWGPAQARDIVDSVGAHIDIIKMPALSLRLQPRDAVRDKLALFRENDMLAFPGGMLLEAAAVTDRVAPFLDEAEQLGIPVIEVSESEVRMAPAVKMGLIETCRARGFKVLAELGPHHADKPFDPDDTIAECRSCLDAGAWLVILEGEVIELMRPWDDPAAADVLSRIVDAVGLKHLIFELIGGSPRTAGWYLRTYGPDVNLGNTGRDQAGIMIIEHVRRALRGGDNWAWPHELNA
jgi:phosphosulfolactate synthase